MRDLTIAAQDGFSLAATLYEGGDELIIINSATATPRAFYHAFAEFLAEAGFSVLTYDYRGIGDSRPPSLRGFVGRMRDWAILDMDGVVEWASNEFGATEIHVIGHSIGGQAMGLTEHGHKVSTMITASAQSGYWRLQGGMERWKVLFIMYTLFPVLPYVVGYFPWSKFGSALDLPKGVALEWGRWCRSKGYILDDTSLPLERFASFTAPVLAISIDDDNWGTERSVRAMMGAYPNVTHRHIDGSIHGIPSLGHFGLFRPRSMVLWKEMVQWIRPGSKPD